MNMIDAETMASAIKDVLLRMNAKVADCSGQCYDDGASNTRYEWSKERGSCSLHTGRKQTSL